MEPLPALEFQALRERYTDYLYQLSFVTKHQGHLFLVLEHGHNRWFSYVDTITEKNKCPEIGGDTLHK